MRYLSVCSGIEAASVAWHHLGWQPVGFSEIEPFPAAVLAHRFPNIPNYGDMTQHESWPITRGAIDLLVGGTPCQSFSVAGLRQGLADPRGNLMLTYLAIADRLRPRWLVWENVPGVLSSNGGRDFGTFLGALGQLGYGWAYRVLDAQYLRVGRWPRAVPQRRRRVFVVGCLGNGAAAGEVLALAEGLQRNLEARRAKGKGVATDAESGVGVGCCGTVSSKWAKGTGGPAGDECYNLIAQPTAYRWQNNRDGLQQDDAVAALRASQGASGFHEMNHPVIAQPVPFTKSKRAQSVTDDETWVDGQVNPTLSLFDQGDTRATTVAVAHAFYSTGGTHGVNQHPEVSPAVKVGSGLGIPSPPAVAHALRGEGFDASEDGTGRGTPLVPVETLPQQGYDAFHASTQETNAVATLQTLRSQIGEEAFAAWGLGILNSLQPQEVLRARLHGLGIRCATFSRSWPIDCAISRKEDRATWAMQSVREAQGEGCPSPGWQLPQQLAEELGAYLSELPRPGAQTERFVRDLWLAGEGIGFLREALSAFQEARRSIVLTGQTPTAMTVRRLTATECEFLQGFPRNWTAIPWRKKPAEECPDGPRYKALGNSMACNCMAWIGERIAAYESQTPNQKEHT